MNKAIDLITVSYDCAHFNKRMGAGPLHLINSGIIEKLRNHHHHVKHKQIVLQEEFATEITSAIKLLSVVKTAVQTSIKNGSFPVVLSGNCCATAGVVSGLNMIKPCVVWFDAHGDCETPETTASGFLDGMALSMLTGNCWNNLLSINHLRSAIKGNNIILIGARDVSKFEKEFIVANGIIHITEKQINHHKDNALQAALSDLSQQGISSFHLHVDADVLDPSIAPANSYAVTNGLTKNDLFETVKILTGKMKITSLTIASYDPSFDVENKMLNTIFELIEMITQSLFMTNII